MRAGFRAQGRSAAGNRPGGAAVDEGPRGQPASRPALCRIRLPEAAAGKSLYGVSFIDAQNGWIVGQQGLCLRTTDGSAHWTELKLDSKAVLRAVQFQADGTGWACGDGDPAAPQPFGPHIHLVAARPMAAGTLLRTIDGGTTWATAWLPTNFEARSLAGTSKSVVIGTSGGERHPDGDLIGLHEQSKWRFTNGFRTVFALATCRKTAGLPPGGPFP